MIKRLKDMELLYGNAVIHVKSDQNEYRIKSVDGFMGEKRPNECRDPHVVIINVKTIHPKKKAGKWVLETFQIRCSQCNKLFSDNLFTSNYCPNCGADMTWERT